MSWSSVEFLFIVIARLVAYYTLILQEKKFCILHLLENVKFHTM
jgi:hypothetical protein